MKSLSSCLRNHRKNLGLTLVEAGEQASIDYSALSRFETGDRVPTLAQLQKLANLYNTTLPKLLKGKKCGSAAGIFSKRISKEAD